MVIGANGRTGAARVPRRYFHVEFTYPSERYPYCPQTASLVGPFDNVQTAIKEARVQHSGAMVVRVTEMFIDGRPSVEHPAYLR
jgi:hypothetical protein